MFVRQLIGRLAGEIVEMHPAVAKACLAAGTAEPVDTVKKRPTPRRPEKTPRKKK